MIEILLGILILFELAKFILSYTPANKKDYYKQRLDAVERQIWDLEFKIFKSKEIREDVRKEFDSTKSRIESLKTQVKNWPKDRPEGDKKRVEDDISRAERDLQRYEAQLRQIDLEIEGSKPTNEYPDGVIGAIHNIDSLNELKKMLQDFIKEL